jgi:phosphoribosylglycinamide formyltransferase-1
MTYICHMIRVAIFASGSGSNAETIFKHLQTHNQIRISAIYCNNPQAGVIARADRLGLPLRLFTKDDLYNNGQVWEQLKVDQIDWIVLAGFLWLMPGELIEAYRNRIINIHPALLPSYGGKGMYGMRVHQAVITAAEKESGITIHLINEEYDRGAILLQKRIFIPPGMSPEELAIRIHQLEHFYFPRFLESHIFSQSQIE